MSQVWRLFGDDIIVNRMFLKTRQNMHPGRAHAHATHNTEATSEEWDGRLLRSISCKYFQWSFDLFFQKWCIFTFPNPTICVDTRPRSLHQHSLSALPLGEPGGHLPSFPIYLLSLLPQGPNVKPQIASPNMWEPQQRPGPALWLSLSLSPEVSACIWERT